MCRSSSSSERIGIGSSFKQQVNCLHMSIPGRMVQRSPLIPVMCIYIVTFINQQLHYLRMPTLSRKMYGHVVGIHYIEFCSSI